MRVQPFILAQSVATLALAHEQSLQSLLQKPELVELASLLEGSPDVVSLIQDGRNVTVFAPTNDALSALNTEKLEQDQITELLSNHVSTFAVLPDDIDLAEPVFVPTFYRPEGGANGTGAPAIGYVEGDEGLQIQSGLAQRVNVVEGPFSFETGNLFIIDGVLSLPLPLEETARELNLTTFAESLSDAGLFKTLSGKDVMTVFAPSNGAFEASQSTLRDLNEAGLREILQYHAITAPYYSRDLDSMAEDQAVILSQVPANYVLRKDDNGDVFINNARIITSDIIIPNGVLHVVDAVLDSNYTFDREDKATPDAGSGAAEPLRFVGTAALCVIVAIMANL